MSCYNIIESVEREKDRGESKNKVSEVRFRFMGGQFNTKISMFGIKFLYIQIYIGTS